MSSDATESVVARAGSLRALGQLDAAERLLRDALGTAPGDAALLTEWAGLLQARGDLPQAEQAARSALQAAPDTLPPYLRLVAVLIVAGRTPEALTITSQLVGMAPDVAGVWAQHALATIDGRGRRLEQVRHAYHRALELEPGSPEWHTVAAVCERVHGNTGLARGFVAAGLERAPQHPALLALRAEYAPVADQPGLLLDLLVTNPGDEESRELLDAAVTWERRAASAVALVPVVVAAVALAGPGLPGAVAATLAAVGGAAVVWAALRRYRRRRDRLPASYLATLRRRGSVIARWAAMVATGLVVLGVAVRWVAVGVVGPAWELASAWVLGTAVVAGLLSVAAPLPGDDRVLRAARARTGRVLWGVGWRFGSLRQELALWTGLGAGVLGLVVAATASSDGAPAGLVTASAWPIALVTATAFVEAVRAGRFAPQRYLRSLGIRYRLLALAGLTIGLVAIGAVALQPPGARGTSDREPAPVSTFTVPGAPAPGPPAPGSPSSGSPVPVPSFSVPSFSVPSFDVPTIPPHSRSVSEPTPG